MKGLYVFIVLCGLAAVVVAGQAALEVSIDSFSQVSPSIVLVTSGSSPQNMTTTAYGDSVDIVGGARDMTLSVSGGLPENLVFSSSVANGIFFVSSPYSGTSNAGYVELKWDGDSESDPSVLNPSGLGGVDFGGSDSAFVFSYDSDVFVSIIINIYSGSVDDYCTITPQLPYSFDQALESIPLSVLGVVGNGCDLSNVGAVTMTVLLTDGMDLSLDFVRVDVTQPTDICDVILYSGGDVCTTVNVDECVPCTAGGTQFSFRFQCAPSNSTLCACGQLQYSTPDCTGTALQAQLPTMSCSDLSGLAPAATVCYAAAQPTVSYNVNFFHSDPGVVEESCTQLGTNSTCMPCTAGGLTNYYSPTCAAGSTPPCVLQEYSEPTCSTAAVKVAMNELSCGQLHDIYTGQAVCAFSYEKLP